MNFFLSSHVPKGNTLLSTIPPPLLPPSHPQHQNPLRLLQNPNRQEMTSQELQYTLVLLKLPKRLNPRPHLLQPQSPTPTTLPSLFRPTQHAVVVAAILHRLPMGHCPQPEMVRSAFITLARRSSMRAPKVGRVASVEYWNLTNSCVLRDACRREDICSLVVGKLAVTRRYYRRLSELRPQIEGCGVELDAGDSYAFSEQQA